MSPPKFVNFGCITIDGGPDSEEGFLHNALTSAAGAATHLSVSEAVANLLACVQQPGPVTLIGHGYDGRICTGAGERNPEDPTQHVGLTQFIAVTNKNTWKRPLRKLAHKVTE